MVYMRKRFQKKFNCHSRQVCTTSIRPRFLWTWRISTGFRFSALLPGPVGVQDNWDAGYAANGNHGGHARDTNYHDGKHLLLQALDELVHLKLSVADGDAREDRGWGDQGVQGNANHVSTTPGTASSHLGWF